MKKTFDVTIIVLLLITLICGVSCASVQNTGTAEAVTADNTEKTEERTEYIYPDAIDMAKASFSYSSHVVEGDEQFNTDSVFSYGGQTYIKLPKKAKEQNISPFVNVVSDGQNRLVDYCLTEDFCIVDTVPVNGESLLLHYGQYGQVRITPEN